ncbi:MAG: hypothetical protein ACXWVR_07510, partial [Rhodoplanes sp.]
MTMQQIQIKIVLFALRVLSDHNHVGARAPHRGRQVDLVDHADDRHIGFRCDDVVKDVEHQWRHSRQEDTNPLQSIASRVREYGTRRSGATEPVDPMKIRMRMQIRARSCCGPVFRRAHDLRGLSERPASGRSERSGKNGKGLDLLIQFRRAAPLRGNAGSDGFRANQAALAQQGAAADAGSHLAAPADLQLAQNVVNMILDGR